MDFQTLAGIHQYCSDYHEGQNSRLYRLLSKIKFNPSDRATRAIRNRIDDPSNEWEQARKVYRTLKRKQSR